MSFTIATWSKDTKKKDEGELEFMFPSNQYKWKGKSHYSSNINKKYTIHIEAYNKFYITGHTKTKINKYYYEISDIQLPLPDEIILDEIDLENKGKKYKPTQIKFTKENFKKFRKGLIDLE